MIVNNTSKLYCWLSISITVIVMSLFITGSPLLTMALDNEGTIPAGTPITWLGFIAFTLCIYWGIQELRHPATQFYQWLSWLLKFLIVLAIFWVPISYGLAGNLSFTFTEKESFQGGQTTMKCFWALSYIIGFGPLIILLTYWTNRVLIRFRGNLNE